MREKQKKKKKHELVMWPIQYLLEAEELDKFLSNLQQHIDIAVQITQL